jgi:hypothetical protein
MMSRNKMFSVLALVAPLAIGAFVVSPVTTVSEASAAGLLPNLCEVSSGACEYTSINSAPVLNANVCWNGTAVTLMGMSGCADPRQAYYLTYGIVADPITNIVVAFSPLKDACDMGHCVSGQLDAGTIVTDDPICCEGDVCKFLVGNCEGEIDWCTQTEAHEDGTVTCHDEEE